MFKSSLINTLRRNLNPINKRFFTSRTSSCSRGISQRSKVSLSILVGLGSLSSYSIYNTIKLDNSVKDIENSISVDSSILPFPTQLNKLEQVNLDADFTLLGHGVRSVTFLGFKVYGIGLYIANNDIPKVKKILNDKEYMSGFKSGSLLTDVLNDPIDSSKIIEKLLDEKVRFIVRICPIRNTDFNHLKDGLIKSILAHPKSKESRDAVGKGLEELRSLFQGRKGSVPKNHLLYLEIMPDAKLNVTYENPSKKKIAKVGVINEPLISKILFLQYLSGKKPLSEPFRKSCIDGLVGL